MQFQISKPAALVSVSLVLGVAIALGVSMVMPPTQASAQELSAADQQQSRTLPDSRATSDVKMYTWYCDTSGVPTYTEIGSSDPNDWGIVIAYYNGDDGVTREFPTIARALRVNKDIIWKMTDEYGGGFYQWTTVGPNRWAATKL